MTKRNVMSWNIMILGYAKVEQDAQVLELYARMHREGVQPNYQTFIGVLKACSRLATLQGQKKDDGKSGKVGCLAKGRAIHSQVVKTGLELEMSVGNTVVNMYAKCGSMGDAWETFNLLPHPNVVTWTTMILGYVEQDESSVALELYSQMQKRGVRPNDRTFVGAFKACSNLAALEEGKQVDGKLAKMGFLVKGRAIHSHMLKGGFESDVFVGTSLVNMYAKCESMEDAWCIFNDLPHRDVVTWNAMILGYSEQDSALALELYAHMYQEGVMTDHRTFVGALKACSILADLENKQMDSKFARVGWLVKGRAIHSQVVKSGFEQNVFVGNSLVNIYMKCGSLEDAKCAFDDLAQRDVVTWNTIILGYAEQEASAVALGLYVRMHQEGVTADHRTFVGLLKACRAPVPLEEQKEVDGKFAKPRCLIQGRALHSQVVRKGFEGDAFVRNNLVNMYVRCTNMQDAWSVFDELPHCDVVMILGVLSKKMLSWLWNYMHGCTKKLSQQIIVHLLVL